MGLCGIARRQAAERPQRQPGPDQRRQPEPLSRLDALLELLAAFVAASGQRGERPQETE